VIGLGFVVARFGLFLHVMHNTPVGSAIRSTLIGVGLVLLGAAAVATATLQHVRFCKNLAPEMRPTPYVVNWVVWFAVILSAIGVALAVHLLIGTSA
jgi:uncharacterized membrane protein YidH (DUF202 family)